MLPNPTLPGVVFSVLQELSGAPQPGYSGLPDPIPHSLRKSIAVYEAGKALTAYITPEYDEIARVSICPYNMITGRYLTWAGSVLPWIWAATASCRPPTLKIYMHDSWQGAVRIH